jgi:cation-transporting ATPase E
VSTSGEQAPVNRASGDAGDVVSERGLDDGQVRERVARGAVNTAASAPSRTVRQIVRANVFTPFNALLGGLLVVILVVGPIQDALFGGVLVANTAIGIFQELRAKRTLDRLAVLTAPRARVVRSGDVREIPVEQVVLDEVLDLRPGDQVVVDGTVLSALGLELDESLLTGESDPVHKGPGDEVLSGSFAVAGSGRYRATRIGQDAYARSLAEEARRFTLVRSELRTGINRIVVLVAWALVPAGTLLAVSQLQANESVAEAARGAVAGVVAMVPEGLVLLTSVAFAVAVVRLGRRRVLVQELPAVEGLARTDVLCIDKTGTLTEGRLAVDGVHVLDERAGDTPRMALGALAAADPNPNATLRAIGEAHPAPADGWRPVAAVPFSSARKWSACTFDGRGTWLLGAPEMVLQGMPTTEPVWARAQALADEGRRVLLLARSDRPLEGEDVPAGSWPVALVTLQDRIREDARPTMDFFRRQEVTVKVISGDNPRTVAAIASQAGLPGAVEAVDARELPDEPAALGHILERSAVFGRVTPRQKRTMVHALQAGGHVVAMTGDGVNDVLALKDADIGIAMGSGSDASRAVANLVLLDSSFAAMPSVVDEGRRVMANIERTAKLFVTKTVYAMLIALAVGVLGFPFPFLPRHLTLIGALTIGIPGFFLTLERSAARARPGFTRRVLRFAVPAGVMAAVATFVAYTIVLRGFDLPVGEARTTATMSLFLVGTAVLVILAQPLTHARRTLIPAMVAAFLAAVTIPPVRDFFELRPPALWVWLLAVGIAAVVAVAVQLAIPGKLGAEEEPARRK